MDLSLYETIITAVLALVMGILGFSLRRNIKENDLKLTEHAQFTRDEFARKRLQLEHLEDRIICMENSLKVITGNYLSRFTDLKDHIAKQGIETLDRINDNRIINIKEHSDILGALIELKVLVKK
jgi:hypothetical protein